MMNTNRPTDSDIIEFFNERAAIMEYDAGLSRTWAELRAKDETRERFGTGALTVVNRFLEGGNGKR